MSSWTDSAGEARFLGVRSRLKRSRASSPFSSESSQHFVFIFGAENGNEACFKS